MKKILIFIIKIYQKVVSPFTKPSCRFQPTCSNYSIDAIETHGFFKGLYLSIRRILKCHPFHAGGYDPVPKKGE
jgi:putative membrane protein insertion efficiency factor